MSLKLKKVLRGILIFFLSIILLLGLAIGITLNFVFTPEKLTPKATEIANSFMAGRLNLESVELTFFSTFPDLEVEMDNGLLVSEQGDSLIAFRSLDVYLNPISIVKGEKIHIDRLYLDRPIIFASLDSIGNTNWNIIDDQSIDSQEDTLTVTSESSDDTYVIENIEINDGAFKFEDYTNFFSMSIQSMDVLGKVYYLNELIDCDLDLAVQNMALTLNDEPILNPISLNFHSRSNIDIAENRILIDTVNLKVVDHELEIESKGIIQLDSLGAINLDLQNRLFTSNIREALDLIPIRYVNLEQLEGKGSVDLKANLIGTYDENQFPVVELALVISDGEASYKNFPKKLDLFETTIFAKIDYLNKHQSFVRMPNLKVFSDGLSLQLNGRVDKILTNPHVILAGNGGVNFEALLETFPIEGLLAGGDVDFNLSTDVYIQDLMNYNFGKIGLTGNANLNNVKINYLNDSITFATTKTTLEFKQDLNASKLGQENVRFLNSKIVFRDLAMNVRALTDVETKRFAVTLKATPLEDSTAISPIRASINLNYGKAVTADSLFMMGRRMKGYVYMTPKKSDQTIPVFRSKFSGDVMKYTDSNNRLTMRNFTYDFKVVKQKNKWPMQGRVKFENFYVFSNAFPKRVSIEKTSLKVATNKITLNNASVKVGGSSVNLSGNIYNLQKMINDKASLKADLNVKSTFLNINEITSILDKADEINNSEISYIDTLDLDTTITQMETFVVPKNVDFKLKLNLDKVAYGDLMLEELKGNVFMKNQIIKLRNLRMKTKAANLDANATYLAKNKSRAKAWFNVKLIDVNVKNMIEIMPFMDTLLPMAKDFEGLVNLGMRGSAKIGKNMALNESTLQAIARIEGENLVLLDGETFQYLAKTLKFKNREKNTLDTLAVEMAIENGALEIFPSLVTMDRYKVALGGIQNLDLTYNYHISVLKSPLPFKTGIDIFGKAEEYDYKITKAKYKYIFSDKEKHKDKLDPEYLRRKNEILEKIKFDD